MYKISAKIFGPGHNYVPKIWCALKIIVPVLVTCLCLWPTSSAHAQRVTYVQKQANLVKVFKAIKKQTHYNVVWFERNLDTKTTFDANFKNATIDEVLKQILLNQPASYEINGKTIVIKPKVPEKSEKLKKTSMSTSEALIEVIGRIVDENNEPLIGAIIRLKNGNKSTSSNANGEFQLKDVRENAILLLSYLGYQTQELTVSGNMETIIMTQAEAKLSEVEINAGYYTVKDKDRTGSISRVTSETLSKQPVSNPLAALIGQMPGVQITQQTGVPGGGFDIMIRGRNSLRKTASQDGNLPFYIIDGVPFIPASFGASVANRSITPSGGNPFSSLSPADIESIEVLKDADATAIYGSRGANGVVLITTKKGKTGQSKFDVNYNYGMGNITQRMKLLNTEQYLEMRKEAFKNDAAAPTLSNAPDLVLWDQHRYTDWQKELLGGTAKTNNLQTSLSGGSAATQYLLSTSYYNEGTVYPKDFNYQKGSLHYYLNHASNNQKFKASFSGTYGIEKSKLPYLDLTSSALLLAPNAPAGYDDNGNLNFTNYYDNPYPYLEWKYKKSSTNFISGLNLSYEIIKGLKLKTGLSYNRFDGKEIAAIPLSAYNPAYGYTSGNATFVDNSSETFLAEPQLNYQGILAKASINVLFGATLQKNSRKGSTLYADGFSNDGLLENITAASSLKGQQFNDAPYNYLALFSRININWEGKYILNLTGRRDGSSRFGPAKRFANFGALGFAWLFAEEKALKNACPWLSTGKVRGSIGVTGSDQIGDFQYLDLWANATTYDGKNGLVPSGLFKDNYSWEKNTKFELALDLGLLEDRIMISGSYYANRSSSQLVGYALAPTTGFNTVISNLPATVQNTGLELELNTKNVHTKRFSWTSAFNLTLPKNKLLKFPNIAGSSYANIFQVGQPLSIKYGYLFEGVDEQSGVYTFSPQQGFSKKIEQKYYGGLQNTLTYGNLDLSIHFQFIKQTGRDLSSKFYYAPGGMINQPVEVLNRWQNPSDLTIIQKFTQNSSAEYSNFLASDQTIVDASFIRLKNLQLAYRIENELIKRLHVQQLRCYLQGQNLFTQTAYKGLDPENQNGALPALRIFTLGIQLTL